MKTAMQNFLHMLCFQTLAQTNDMFRVQHTCIIEQIMSTFTVSEFDEFKICK